MITWLPDVINLLLVDLDSVVVMNARVVSESPSPLTFSSVYSLVGILGESNSSVNVSSYLSSRGKPLEFIEVGDDVDAYPSASEPTCMVEARSIRFLGSVIQAEDAVSPLRLRGGSSE